MAKEWVMVRLERSVHADLLVLIERLEQARQKGQTTSVESDGPVSVSEMVSRLLRHDANDQRRKREAEVRRRARLREEQDSVRYTLAEREG